MAAKSKEEVTISRSNSPEVEVSAETREKAQQFIDNYVASLKDRTEAYKHRMAETQARTRARPEAAGPLLAGGYQYFNCLTLGPIQFFADPPYRPSKIIAGGEETLMLGVVWINPANGPGGSLPGTVVLGGRNYRVRFETINLSNVVSEEDREFTGAFDNPAEDVYVFEWWRTWPDPGVNPKLYETVLTVDIVEAGQPMAAFSTWHYDPDTEPWFLVDLSSLPAEWGIPVELIMQTQWPGLQYKRPARFLVYRK